MAELRITLKRVDEKGYIKFKAPEEIELQIALRSILKLCRDKYNWAAQHGIILREE